MAQCCMSISHKEAEGGEEGDEAMGSKKRKQIWKSWKLWKAGEEMSIYKAIQ